MVVFGLPSPRDFGIGAMQGHSVASARHSIDFGITANRSYRDVTTVITSKQTSIREPYRLPGDTTSAGSRDRCDSQPGPS